MLHTRHHFYLPEIQSSANQCTIVDLFTAHLPFSLLQTNEICFLWRMGGALWIMPCNNPICKIDYLVQTFGFNIFLTFWVYLVLSFSYIQSRYIEVPQLWMFSLFSAKINFLKRGSLLGNEETHLGGDSPIFEIIYSNLEQTSIFPKKSTHFYVRIKIGLK